MNVQRGLPTADSAAREEQLHRLYQQRELVSSLIDSLERYRALLGHSDEWRTGDSGIAKKPCMPSYQNSERPLVPGAASAPLLAAVLPNRRAG